MLRTRGVPGTHNAALGAALFDALDEGREFSMPRFDKSLDDRAPRADWDVLRADTRLVIFEGWCVGARAQPETALMPPVNELERNEDSNGIWRRHVNMVLGGVGYQRLFHRIDVLILLAAPNFSVVRRWRLQQEHELSGRTGDGMSDDEVSRFVMHYERLSRFILAEMPLRADMVIRLREDRSVQLVKTICTTGRD